MQLLLHKIALIPKKITIIFKNSFSKQCIFRKYIVFNITISRELFEFCQCAANRSSLGICIRQQKSWEYPRNIHQTHAKDYILTITYYSILGIFTNFFNAESLKPFLDQENKDAIKVDFIIKEEKMKAIYRLRKKYIL